MPRETPGHVVGAITTFVGASTGLIALSQRVRTDVAWADLSRHLLLTGCAMLALFVVFGAFAINEGAPLNSWAGLIQRAVVIIWFTYLVCWHCGCDVWFARLAS